MQFELFTHAMQRFQRGPGRIATKGANHDPIREIAGKVRDTMQQPVYIAVNDEKRTLQAFQYSSLQHYAHCPRVLPCQAPRRAESPRQDGSMVHSAAQSPTLSSAETH